MLRCTIRANRHRLEKLLVADRGEVACRIIRTCREMHIRTVALFNEAECNAKHVLAADEAVCIGPSAAYKRFPPVDSVLAAAKRLNVDSIHPGCSSLSDNAGFADAVTCAGMKFIGSPASVISCVRSKAQSRRAMEAAGIPVVPSYFGDDSSMRFVEEEAKRIGFPVVIEVVTPSGSRETHMVERADVLADTLKTAKWAAARLSKNDRVVVERYIPDSRCVECHIFSDGHGNGVFLAEQDGSVQQGPLKLVEEAPAPYLSAEMRQRLGETAVRAAKLFGHVGAGTVKFILDTHTQEAYVTELHAGMPAGYAMMEEVCRINGKPLDLVRLQIETATDMPLPFSQEEVALEGSCFEACVRAELLPQRGAPGGGRLAVVREPFQGARGFSRTRLDANFVAGDDVPAYSDPLLARLISWGRTREEALVRLREALGEYRVLGVDTNTDFLTQCCEAPSLGTGDMTTNFVADHSGRLLTRPVVAPEVLAMAAVVSLLHQCGDWRAGFRLNGVTTAAVHFCLDSEVVQVALRVDDITSTTVSFSTLGQVGSFSVDSDAATVRPRGFESVVSDLVVVFESGSRYSVSGLVTEREVAILGNFGLHRIRRVPLTEGFGSASALGGGSASIDSPMPGKVSQLLVKDGDTVRKGQVLLTLEAMKMEHLIKATKDGKVSFYVKEGEMVKDGCSLAAVE